MQVSHDFTNCGLALRYAFRMHQVHKNARICMKTFKRMDGTVTRVWVEYP